MARGIALAGVRVAVAEDVSSASSVRGLVETVTARLGPIDGLVNSHGLTRRGAAADYTRASARRWRPCWR